MIWDVAVIFFPLAVIAGIFFAVVGAQRGAGAIQKARTDAVDAESAALAMSEEWAAWFLTRYPSGTDEQIATLMRDELVNRRIASAANRRWATADTVGRVRRTMVRAVIE